MLTGREHLRFQATLRGIGKATAAERTAELLDRVGLTEAADRRVGDYSGGMKRRLDLAMALVHQPAILFLDEPTTGLDLQSRAGLWDEVARLAYDDGATVFLTGPEVLRADSGRSCRGPACGDKPVPVGCHVFAVPVEPPPAPRRARRAVLPQGHTAPAADLPSADHGVPTAAGFRRRGRLRAAVRRRRKRGRLLTAPYLAPVSTRLSFRSALG